MVFFRLVIFFHIRLFASTHFVTVSHSSLLTTVFPFPIEMKILPNEKNFVKNKIKCSHTFDKTKCLKFSEGVNKISKNIIFMAFNCDQNYIFNIYFSGVSHNIFITRKN